MPQVDLYVDGACKGNPGPGGWGLVGFCDGVYDTHMFELTDETTTNNREELKAMIEAIKLAIECNLYETTPVTIYSDSAYVVNTINDWIWSWAKNNWMNSKKKTVENIDLMKIIYNYLNTNFCPFQVVKIPGHSDIVGNEFADALATGNTKKALNIVTKNPQKFENFKNL